MSLATPAPDRASDTLRGDRALAVRIIGETGARAACRPFADALHPPARRRRVDLGLDRIPGDVVRRGLRRVNRIVVRHAGGLLLALRRVDSDEAVRQIHHLDHRCFELEQRLAAVARAGDGST